MALLFFRTMSLHRRIRHQASRRQLVREVFSCYILAFVFVFLDLHFIGIKHYNPSFHREYLPVNAAAHQAVYWAFAGPSLCLLDDVLRRNEMWTSLWGLDYQIRGLVLGGAAAIIAATVVAWHWMLPLWGLAAAVVLFLRFSRPKDSL
jgi:hypothetical protein